MVKNKLQIFYCLMPNTNLGNIWIATSEKGLIAVDFNITENEFIQWIGKKIHASFVHDPKPLQIIQDQIIKYLSDESKEFDLPIDFSLFSPFQKEVMLAAQAIPRGHYSTYGEIAKILGKPKAFQAVGQALHYNPIPIVLPCHRVIGSDGSLGGYSGEMNSEQKRKLLQLEGAILF